MTEHTRRTVKIQSNGRMVIPNETRKILGIKDQEAFCEIETYSKDKAVITILNRWTSDRDSNPASPQEGDNPR